MVELGEVAQFMDQHVVDAVLGCLDKQLIQGQATAAGAAAPMGAHPAQCECPIVLDAVGGHPLQAVGHAFPQDDPCPVPAVQHSLGPVGSLDRDQQLSTRDPDALLHADQDPQAMLTAQVTVRLPAGLCCLNWRHGRLRASVV
jgi:hypothetical protein